MSDGWKYGNLDILYKPALLQGYHYRASCQQEIWIVSISSSLLSDYNTYLQCTAPVSWQSTTWESFRNPDNLSVLDIRNPGCSSCSRSDLVKLRSCLPSVFISNSSLAQLKCLAICHHVNEKMTSHLARTEPQPAPGKTGLPVNFNNQAGRWRISEGYSCDMASYQDQQMMIELSVWTH